MINNPDQHLASRIQGGDPEAETELVHRFGARIARMIDHKLGFSNPERQDLVNEILMALLVSLREGRYHAERGVSLGTYAYGIAANKLKDYYKNRKKSLKTVDTAAVDIAYDAQIDSRFDQKEQDRRIRELLSRLDDKYKEILYLKYYKELSVHEISELIQLPPRRVSERLNYAVRLLRKECRKNRFSIFLCIWLIYG